MKYAQVSEAGRQEFEWKKYVAKPLILGLAFGTGCYLAKVIINSPLMENIVNVTVQGVKEVRRA
jgi:hypothetical protein